MVKLKFLDIFLTPEGLNGPLWGFIEDLYTHELQPLLFRLSVFEDNPVG